MKSVAAALLLVIPANSLLAEELLPPDQATLKAHVQYLASDGLRGRETGTGDYDAATAYVAARMAEAGLLPAGDRGSWYQSVPLIATRAIEKATMTIDGMPLEFGTDFIGYAIYSDEHFAISGSVLFVGYGIVDPAGGQDDYEGVDCRGKIVAMLYGAPAAYANDVRAHLGDVHVKAASARRCGAAGIIVIESDNLRHVFPFERLASIWDERHMAILDPRGRADGEDPPLFAVVSLASAAKLFAGSSLSWEEIAAADRLGQDPAKALLAATISFRQENRIERLASDNVIGYLPGFDPRLSAEYIAVSAHLDHIGATAPDKTDTISNGAIDNAIGVASLIEIARLFQANGARPKRSLVFLALTGEEKGLLGSKYFAEHPTVPKAGLVADVNIDAPILTYRFEDIIAYGAEHSSMARTVSEVVRRNGLMLQPDPEPEQGLFVRSDSYSFARQGIPAVWLGPGIGGNGKAARDEFYAHHYHQPSDDMAQPFDWSAGRAFVKVNYEIVSALADAPDRPRWTEGDYFGRLFGRPAAR